MMIPSPTNLVLAKEVQFYVPSYGVITFVSNEIIETLGTKSRAIRKSHDKLSLTLWKDKIVVWRLVPFDIYNVIYIEFAYRAVN